jgi:aminopeptidase N
MSVNLISSKFDLPTSDYHYLPTLRYRIDRLKLDISVDFSLKQIVCNEELAIKTLQTTSQLSVDCSNLEVISVCSVKDATLSPLEFRILNEKLEIKLQNTIPELTQLIIRIAYRGSPTKGFYFIDTDQNNKKYYQAWTQNEPNDAKFWLPCLDHPMSKFRTEMSVTVPSEYSVISNGILSEVSKEESIINGKKVQFLCYHWQQDSPIPAYLVSLVIGKFKEIKERHNGKTDLIFYIPHEREEDAIRSFANTGKMLNFYENYLGINYPFKKYSQVTVDKFAVGGMENSSCTTLTINTLHDKRADQDYSSDPLVSHELAHQWFGDLVTCRDWQDIWLNEGFATYCEALYWEYSRGKDEYLYYVFLLFEDYFDEYKNKYSRQIVTNYYSYKDDLFDRHTYEKGSSIVHMIRNILGDEKFRSCLKSYLKTFSNSVADTHDLRRIIEDNTGLSFQRFFDQWLFSKGHPTLKIEIETRDDLLCLRIEQVQENIFDFELEVKISYDETETNLSSCIHLMHVKDKICVFEINLEYGINHIRWISVDPCLKILKQVKSIVISKEFLLRQLTSGDTVIERVDAARALKDYITLKTIDALGQVIISDGFWGVSVEAARSLGSIKSTESYNKLRECFLQVKHPKIRRAVIRALGDFRKQETIDLLKNVIESTEESYFVLMEAAIAIGKTRVSDMIPNLVRLMDTKSFQSMVAQGAILGLREFKDNDDVILTLLEKTSIKYDDKIRETATYSLGQFAKQPKIYDALSNLLTDDWFRVRVNACKAFGESEIVKSIDELTYVAEHDNDNRVRRIAFEAINKIRESNKPNVAELVEEMDKLKFSNVELLQKIDRIDREIIKRS